MDCVRLVYIVSLMQTRKFFRKYSHIDLTTKVLSLKIFVLYGMSLDPLADLCFALQGGLVHLDKEYLMATQLYIQYGQLARITFDWQFCPSNHLFLYCTLCSTYVLGMEFHVK